MSRLQETRRTFSLEKVMSNCVPSTSGVRKIERVLRSNYSISLSQLRKAIPTPELPIQVLRKWRFGSRILNRPIRNYGRKECDFTRLHNYSRLISTRSKRCTSATQTERHWSCCRMLSSRELLKSFAQN